LGTLFSRKSLIYLKAVFLLKSPMGNHPLAKMRSEQLLQILWFIHLYLLNL